MKTSIFTFISLILLLSSCSKNKDEPKNYDNIITGFVLRDPSGVMMAHIGSPNIKVTKGETLQIASYPNPCRQFINIYIRNIETDTPIKIAITKDLFKEDSDVDIINYTSLSEITSDIIFEDIIDNKNYDVDLSSFDDGYYRVYIEIDGDVYFDNIMKGDLNSIKL